MQPWPHFPSRKTNELDGLWDAVWLGVDCDVDSVRVDELQFPARLPVPGCFDASPAFAGQRGAMAYRTRTYITPGAPSIIRFGATGLWARIYVDGMPLYACDLPYSGFTVEVPPADVAERELVVLVDNRCDPVRTPLFRQFYDFYGYGGIYRSVSWMETPAHRIDRAHVRTLNPARGTVEVCLRLAGDIPPVVTLSTAFDGGPATDHGERAVTDGCVYLELTVPDPQPWSTEIPHLHVLKVWCDGDLVLERFGLRTIVTEGQQILLNGDPIKLLGFCRHEAHPQFGPALPLSQILDDLQMLADMGCNFIRGSHYPQDQRFLDACDELGFLVWEEALGWGNAPKQWDHELFLDANLRQARAMVRNSFNHPCVVLWGVLNEGASENPVTRPLYQGLAEAIRSEDRSRPFTYATNRLNSAAGDQHLDLVDVVSVNTYPGWYERNPFATRPLDGIVSSLHRSMAILEEQGHGDKPLIISEIGAGAIYGWRDRHHAHWSEEYQAELLELVCREIVTNPRYAGVSLWQFCDIRTFDTSRALARPRAFNNKGVVDEFRRPKLAYDAVKAVFAPPRTAQE